MIQSNCPPPHLTAYLDAPVDAGNAEYEPFLEDGMVGYRVTHHDTGRVRFVYFNPSECHGDEEPAVFVYVGEHGNPSLDGAAHHYCPFYDR